MKIHDLRFPVAALASLGLLAASTFTTARAADLVPPETPAQKDARMAWFREARFGMFIHWGVYAVPAGEWNGKKNYGEWFMEETKMPVSQYEKFATQFNPVKFDAKAWVRMAKDAGMKYIVITSKHHDGFGLWPSAQTDWCIKSTPFKRDPLRELADACAAAGIKLCFYHSIMDWHHPDWGTRRAWNDKATGEPDMDRYTSYMKAQLKELLTGYGPLGIVWFDGEWEKPWTNERGADVYNFLRGLQPGVIINNRIGKARAGMAGMDKEAGVGDYGTPEQEIPATGFGAGVDWESCMTMNRHWGYNKNDQDFKSTQTLVRNLIDCASKGGNYLLNIGPTAEGEFPQTSIQRLAEMGAWMKKNSESIYGTQASPFASLAFGRCTQKKIDGGNTRLYLHVYDWPKDGRLVLPGLANLPVKASLLDGGKAVQVAGLENRVVLSGLPSEAPDSNSSVIALDIQGAPNIVKIDPYAEESKEQRDARMKWWREARFGMFIHWGVYAVPAGTYHGDQIKSIGEWIMNRAKIPCAEYQTYASKFNPVKYNADEWVQLAKEAGMKYIVITSKHHDGFALFGSKASKWNVVDSTPYGKDLLAPLAEACRKHGLKLGFYYSQAQDWNNGGSASGGKWDKDQVRSMDEYIEQIAVPQVREILTQYGEFPAVLWWDTPTDMNAERAEQLLPLLKLKPGLIHNNRLGGGYKGDTETPEQHIPAMGYKDRDWETCMTMNDTWGFKSYDDNWKPVETLVRNLVDIASKGGNYLLNVGPTAEGLIPGPSVERLKTVGAWMKVNSESIYDTTASPFKAISWGRCTKKVCGDAATLYLHVFDWPKDGKLVVPGLKNAAECAYLLSDSKKAPLATAMSEDGLVVTLPGVAPDPVCSVVVLKVKGALNIEVQPIAQEADGKLTLSANDAILHGELKLEQRHTKGNLKAATSNIGFWLKPQDWVEWPVKIGKSGKFKVSAEIASQGSGSFQIVSGNQKLVAKAPNTGDYAKFKKVDLGVMELPAGKMGIAIKPVKEGWTPFNLRDLTLAPQ